MEILKIFLFMAFGVLYAKSAIIENPNSFDNWKQQSRVSFDQPDVDDDGVAIKVENVQVII